MHGLYLLWWVQEKHVPVAVVAALLAAGDLTITALEIPTGWLADRCGHRASLIAGSLAQVAGMLWCWLGGGVPGLLFAIVLVALGDAFRSGADQALLYRSCVALEREQDFQRVEARSRSVQLVALVALTLAGGAIVETWGFGIGWLVEAALCAVGLSIACAMVEPSSSVGETLGRPDAASGAGTPIRPVAAQSGLLLKLIVPASLLGAIASAAEFVAQTSGVTDPERMTMLVAVITLAEAAGSAVAAHFPAGVRSQVWLAGIGTAIAVAAFALPSAFLPGVVALSFLVGVAHPLRAAAIQRLAADHVRARAASMASACDKAVGTVALVCAGSLPRRHSRAA
jgi:MFS family permease